MRSLEVNSGMCDSSCGPVPCPVVPWRCPYLERPTEVNLRQGAWQGPGRLRGRKGRAKADPAREPTPGEARGAGVRSRRRPWRCPQAWPRPVRSTVRASSLLSRLLLTSTPRRAGSSHQPEVFLTRPAQTVRRVKLVADAQSKTGTGSSAAKRRRACTRFSAWFPLWFFGEHDRALALLPGRFAAQLVL